MVPYRKMYGEDKFVCQSVWSNTEDYVTLSNKPYDLMGLEALPDNIISDYFSGDDD